jgi:hypothetical protein
MIDSRDRRTVPSAIERLSAPGPFAPDKDELMLYGRLIGAWDVEWVAFDENGDAVERRRGEWHFAWVLGGRGVQDVIWTAGAPVDHPTPPPSGGRSLRSTTPGSCGKPRPRATAGARGPSRIRCERAGARRDQSRTAASRNGGLAAPRGRVPLPQLRD